MPGIYGYYGKLEKELLARKISELLSHNENWFEGKTIYHNYGFHGFVDFKSNIETSTFSLNGINIVVYGNIYSYKERKLESSKAEILFSLYKNHKTDFLKDLNGSFILSIYDNDTIIIASDRLGSKNLFYTINSNSILYSSEIKAILADRSIISELNLKAIIDFFTYSFILGNKTFFIGIELLPPASILIKKKESLRIVKYWDLNLRENRHNKLDFINLLKRFNLVMKRAVDIRMADKDIIGIFLSGGLDSRLIAGFAQKNANKTNKELISYTFGTKNGLQERIAKKVSKNLKIKNKFYEIPSSSLAKYAEEVVYKGDGHIRIRDAHFISFLREIRTEVDTILVGLFGSELFGEMLSNKLSKISSKIELTTYLFNQYKNNNTADHISNLFMFNFPLISEIEIIKNFSHTLKEIPSNNYNEIADWWEIRQRDRRYIIPISNYMNWYIDTRLPFLDNEIVNFALSLPLALRINKRFIQKAIRYDFPNLSSIPWEKTGLPIKSKNLFIKLNLVKRDLLRIIKKLIEKISLGNIYIRNSDYRSYDYFLRTSSRNYLTKILLHTLNNPILNQKYIKEIVEEHMKMRKNHEMILCDILNTELMHSNFFCNEFHS